MVILDLESSLCVHVEAEALGAVSRNALCNMDCEVAPSDKIGRGFLIKKDMKSLYEINRQAI